MSGSDPYGHQKSYLVTHLIIINTYLSRFDMPHRNQFFFQHFNRYKFNSIYCVCMVSIALGLLINIASAVDDTGDKRTTPQTGKATIEVYDSQATDTPRMDAQIAASSAKLPAGFRLQVAAQQPDVAQPIAMAWDSRGRLWIVENYTYAEQKMKFEDRLSDRILIFEDRDNDGTLETRKVFWDQGKHVTSIEIGYGGVWVLGPPQLLFIPDHDRDDVPDSEPQVVLDGFDALTTHHNMANGLRFGPDGWLYGRHGIQAVSKVGPPGSSDLERKSFSCAIWRYHPQQKIVDVVTHGTTNSWGMDWDKNGHLFFINTVIGHLWHALPNAHLRRMYGEHIAPDIYESMEMVADHFHFDQGKEDWTAVRKGVSDATDAAGGGHAHSGMLIYQADQWPQEYRDKLYTINFHGRRLNVERLDRGEAGFIGRHEADFCFMADPWFRGIDLSTGPDGSVFILDWSDTGECHENDGVHRQSGTIYRLTYGDKKLQPVTDLRALSDADLLDYAKSDNAWYSRQAQIILRERKIANLLEPKTIANLKQIVSPEHRHQVSLRELWAAQACGVVDIETLYDLLSHPNEHIRCSAIRSLSEPSIASQVEVAKLLSSANKETSNLARLYWLGALPRWNGDGWWNIATTMIKPNTLDQDRDYPLMLWYAIKDRLVQQPAQGAEFLGKLYQTVEAKRLESVPFRKVVHFAARRLATIMQQDPLGIESLVKVANRVGSSMQKDVMLGMFEGTKGRSRLESPSDFETLAASLQPALVDPSEQDKLKRLRAIFGDGLAREQLEALVNDQSQEGSSRREALLSLYVTKSDGTYTLAKKYVRDLALQSAAIEIILKSGSVADAQEIIDLFTQPFAIRGEARDVVIRGLAGRRETIPLLIEAVEAKRIDSNLVDAIILRQFVMLDDSAITSRVEKIWPQVSSFGKDKLTKIQALEKLVNESEKTPDLANGRQLFRQHCSSCHKLFGEGGTTAPELTGAQRSNLRYLSENIIDPSASVADNYRVTLFQMSDGTLVSGVAIIEDSATVTVQTTKDKIVIEKSEIESRKRSTQSLMPEGLLDTLDDQANIDLVAYLKSSHQVP
jgi:putative membrane-bound dehydrogenase-like protein